MHPATPTLGPLNCWQCLLFGVLGVVLLDGRQVFRIYEARGELVWEIEKRSRDDARLEREKEQGRSLKASWSESHAFATWMIMHLIRALIGGAIASITGAVGPVNALAATMCGITGQLGLDKAGESEAIRRLLVDERSSVKRRRSMKSVSTSGESGKAPVPDLGEAKAVSDEA